MRWFCMRCITWRRSDCPKGHPRPFSEEYQPSPIAQGSVHDISYDGDDRGFYLANGRWHAIPKSRMGF